jgi:methylglutaconyl-CoA hydratase
VRNAFNDEVIGRVDGRLPRTRSAPEVRCIVLAANGPAFCAAPT